MPLFMRMGCRTLAAMLIFTPAIAGAGEMRQSDRPSPPPIEQLLRVNVPVVLCIDDKPTRGGQPSAQAYAQAAANGYRSIVTLRNEKDGIALLRERSLVERQKMRYFNIPVVPNAPTLAQADEFLALVRDRANHPMLINCAFADRVAPLMMILRIVEQRWSKEKAIEEAIGMGLAKEPLEKFAGAYLAQRKLKPS